MGAHDYRNVEEEYPKSEHVIDCVKEQLIIRVSDDSQ